MPIFFRTSPSFFCRGSSFFWPSLLSGGKYGPEGEPNKMNRYSLAGFTPSAASVAMASGRKYMLSPAPFGTHFSSIVMRTSAASTKRSTGSAGMAMRAAD